MAATTRISLEEYFRTHYEPECEFIDGELRPKPMPTRLSSAATFWVPIETFDPEPFELRRPVSVVVQAFGNSFVASLFDANINASGETAQDAVANLKDLILALFIRLGKEPNQRLQSKIFQVPTELGHQSAFSHEPSPCLGSARASRL